MKTTKRLLAAGLVLAMLCAFTACHKKNEIAVTVGEEEFTSAYYMCALINADSEAKSKVQETLTDEEKQATDIDYYSKKVEDKSFVKWVEDTALENLKKIAAYKALCKENKLEISEEDRNNAETYADYYWNNYGYSSYFEPNGVGQETYKKYMLDSNYAATYFEHIYGAEGTKAIAADALKTKMLENFQLADKLDVTFSEETDEQKAAMKTKLDGYVEALQKGSMTYEQVYKDHNGTTEEADTAETEGSDDPKPQDSYAELLGTEDTSYASDYYETVKNMAVGEVKLVEKEEGAGYVLLVKKDLSADAYYLTQLDLTLRHLIADDDFDKEIEAYANKLKTTVNDYAVKQFKVKKIKTPSAS